MTTKTSKAKAAQPKQVESVVASSIDALLRRNIKIPGSNSEKIDGVLIGMLQSLNSQGQPLISVESIGLEEVPARTLIAVSENDRGKAVALGFEAGNPGFPIILGYMQTSESYTRIGGNKVVVDTQDGRVVVTAEDELELRCGEAVILMQSDGRITLRGQYITSHADAGQRIRGGSVQIN